MQINGQTRLAGVLGHPIAHTASPAMHNAAFSALHLNWRYVALDVDPHHLKTALRGLATSGFAGVNLTVPHKILALPLVDQVHPDALRMGAINTIRFSPHKKGFLAEGFNTDGYGLLQALKEEFSFNPRGKTIAVLGCGGAGRGIAIQLAMSGAHRLILLNRTRARASAIARKIQALRLKTTCTLSPEPCHLLIQATSLGLKPSDPLPISRNQLELLQPELLFDTIYRPCPTSLMKLASRLGIPSTHGLGMLLHQGARAFEIWTNRRAPVEIMRQALLKEVRGPG